MALHATRGLTDIRGLDTAGRWVGGHRGCVSRIERHRGHGIIPWWLIAVSQVGGLTRAPGLSPQASHYGRGPGLIHSARRFTSGAGVSSRVASDQHHPASSRAMATLATEARLPRAWKRSHRECSRRLLA